MQYIIEKMVYKWYAIMELPTLYIIFFYRSLWRFNRVAAFIKRKTFERYFIILSANELEVPRRSFVTDVDVRDSRA